MNQHITKKYTSPFGWKVIPPLNLPLNPTKPQPSQSDWDLMINYLLRQGCNKPSPLTAWLLTKELQYYNGPGHSWDYPTLAYAAARDAASYQTSKSELSLLKFLKSSLFI